MKDVKFPISKVVYSLIIACLSSILVSFSSVFSFSFTGFIILFLVYLFSTWNLETKEYIFYYFIKTTRALFFFLPIASIFYSFSLTNTMVGSSGSTLEAGATALGGAIGSFMIILLCLIIGLVGGLIIGAFAKKPKEEQNTGRSIGILFLVILILLIYYLNQTSEIEKAITGNTGEISNNSSDIISTTGSGIVENKEVNNNSKNEKKLSDLIFFKLTSYNFVKGDWSDSFEFSYELENKSGKDILGYKGSFELFDMFGDSLGKFNLDKIEKFNSGAIIKEKGNYSYNQYLTENVKLGKAKFEDLKYKYNISEIIYKDNYDFSNKVFGTNTGKDIDKVSYEILNKVPKKGDFQNYIEFELKITNNSGKTIKGIKGGFSIYDIFGEKLGSYELNITKDIKSGAMIKDKVQYSINEYINEENKVYETDFGLLRYNFDIENIVYSE